LSSTRWRSQAIVSSRSWSGVLLISVLLQV
jgi:hypothetical protein